MIRIIRNGLAALLLCAVVAAGDAAAEKSVLPGDIFLHIATGPLDTSLKAVEDFAVPAVEGTPAAAMMQPGMLQMGLPMALKVPPGILDLKRGLQVVFCTPAAADREPALAVLLPVAGMERLVAKAKEMQLEVKGPEAGVVTIHSPMGGPQTFVDAGPDFVAIGPDLELARAAVRSFLDWKQPAAKPNAAPILVTFDSAKLLEHAKEAIEQGLKAMTADIEKEAAAPGVPPGVQAAMRLTPAYLRELVDLGRDLRSARFYVYFEKAGMRISGYATPKPNTGLARFAKAAAAGKPEFAHLPLLPEESALVEAIRFDEGMLKEFSPFVERASREFIGALLSAEEGKAMAEQMKGILAIGIGETVVGITPAGSGQNTRAYLTTKNPAAYPKTLGAFIETAGKTVEKLLSTLTAQAGTPLPVAFQFRFNEKAGTAAGTPYSLLDIQFTAKEGADAPPALAESIAKLEPLLRDMAQRTAVVDQTVVTAAGPGGETELVAAIEALKSKTPGLGNRKPVMDALAAPHHQNKQVAFGALFMLDLFKSSLGQSTLFAPPGEAGKIVETMKVALEAMPKSTVPFTFSLGAVEKAREGEEGTAASFAFCSHVPSLAISEIAKAMTQFQMAMQAAAQGEAEPPVIDAEPAEEEEGGLENVDPEGKKAKEF